MNKNLILPVKGTRDFYPEDWAFETWLYEKVKEVSELFGFQEYEGPTLESLELYVAKSGEELVKKQSFTLTDQAGNILALRPEMTPTLARMIAQKSPELTFPVKWFCFGRRFRYEQPQKGRAREFFQWDADILGSENPQSDAEIISLASTFCQKVGLTPEEIKIKINDRQLLEKKFLSLGIDQNDIVKAFRLADKKGKMEAKEFSQTAKESGFSEDQAKAILQILEEKNSFLDSPSLLEVFELLKRYGVAEYVEFDPGVVRGLEYYTGIVSEGWDTKGEFRAIFGGGRYDNLTVAVGGKQKIPGVGFALGDMVIAEVLKANNKYPILPFNKTKVLVTVFSPKFVKESIQLAATLRNNRINTELYFDSNAKLDKQIKYADRKKIPYVAIIGPDEVKRSSVTLKDLNTQSQKTLSLSELIKEL